MDSNALFISGNESCPHSQMNQAKQNKVLHDKHLFHLQFRAETATLAQIGGHTQKSADRHEGFFPLAQRLTATPLFFGAPAVVLPMAETTSNICASAEMVYTQTIDHGAATLGSKLLHWPRRVVTLKRRTWRSRSPKESLNQTTYSSLLV